MEPDARYTLIGSLVIGLITALAVALLWVGGTGSGSAFHHYRVFFEKQSVEGLQVGSDVNMRGVKVGRVENFAISTENINRVSVEVRVDRLTPVSSNTEAIVSRNLVTGLARIDLDTPGTPGPPLLEKPGSTDLPVIAEGRASLDEITESAGSLMVSARQGLNNVNQMFSAPNRELLQQILVSLRDTTGKLDERLAIFAGAAESFSIAVEQIGQNASPLTREARATLKQMRTSMRDVSAAVRTMEANTVALAKRAGDAADVGVSEMQATAREFRSGVDILSRTLDRLQDPRSALLGPGQGQLGPGENR